MRLAPGAGLVADGRPVPGVSSFFVDADGRLRVNEGQVVPVARLDLRIEGSVVGSVVARGSNNHVTVTGVVHGNVEATYATTTAPAGPTVTEVASGDSSSDGEYRQPVKCRPLKRLRRANSVDSV